MKPCKDCAADDRIQLKRARPAIYPGPRCATHNRLARKAARERAHARRVENGYGITAEAYWALYEAQGRCCYVCRQATGRTKRLAVDHDHATGEVRALLCGRCNRLIAFLDPDALGRAIEVLTDPPARKVLK